MENTSDRGNKIKAWFSSPYNALLVLVLLIALALRLFFFIKTSGQTLWWDEAEYMSAAKEWAFGIPYEYNPQRPPLFQALSAIVFLLGLSENFIKLLFVVVPSLALVAATYYLGKEMYNEKVGIIGAFLMTISWSVLFWSSRVQPDFFSMTFQVLSVLFMWKSWKQEIPKWGVYAGIFAALGFYFKVSALLVPIAFLLFILIRDRWRGVLHKNHWYFAIGFIATFIPYMIWSQISFGNPFAFKLNYSIAFTEAVPRPIGWYNLEFFYLLTEGLLFVLFVVGLVYALRFLLYGDIILKNRKDALNPDLFSVLVLILVSAFFIFYIRGTEDRWVFLWLPFMFYMIGNALMILYGYIQKYQAFIAATVVVLILAFAGYQQVNHASTLIEQKLTSYMPVQQAGLWVKDNYDRDTKLLSISYTQSVYYSEANVSTYSTIPDPDAFNDYLRKTGAELVQVSAWEQHPPWIQDWINRENAALTPVFADSTSSAQPPTIVVFKVNQEALT